MEGGRGKKMIYQWERFASSQKKNDNDKISKVKNNVNYKKIKIVVLEKQYKKIILVEVTLDQILDLECIYYNI